MFANHKTGTAATICGPFPDEDPAERRRLDINDSLSGSNADEMCASVYSIRDVTCECEQRFRSTARALVSLIHDVTFTLSPFDSQQRTYFGDFSSLKKKVGYEMYRGRKEVKRTR